MVSKKTLHFYVDFQSKFSYNWNDFAVWNSLWRSHLPPCQWNVGNGIGKTGKSMKSIRSVAFLETVIFTITLTFLQWPHFDLENTSCHFDLEWVNLTWSILQPLKVLSGDLFGQATQRFSVTKWPPNLTGKVKPLSLLFMQGWCQTVSSN